MYTIHDLTREFGVSAVTIHRYIRMGLLPPPVGRTRAARYGADHWRRLEAIRRARERNVTLADLKERLAA